MKETILITGAAGFIGRAACAHYQDRFQVIGIDNMSRGGARIPPDVMFVKGDAATYASRIPKVDIVIHLAAQVSVVESVLDPVSDLHSNAIITLELAQWAKRAQAKCFIYASTNKVYGELPGISTPILDAQPIAPETPYGISKAAGGLYVRDLLPTIGYDFRQSCIYGPDQLGDENQGWIGYLRQRAAHKDPVACYGDGTQVRDLLHIKDLLWAYDLAIDGSLAPGSYTVGGGPENAISFTEAVERIGTWIIAHKPWRPKDQRYFVAAADGLRKVGWWPTVDTRIDITNTKGVRA